VTITLLSIFRRREGMSHEEFVQHYETVHARIGEKVMSGYATRYVRRFLTPFGRDDDGAEADVVMEMDFPDEGTMEAFFASVQDPEIAAMIAEDEPRLFDSASMRTYRIDERESELPPVLPPAHPS
tara:strand:+ start:4793 stop:5170 length:378 start_codon:yes stop_codon:yes gene_type:complete